MSWLRKAARTVGSIGKKAAPFAALIPGVGIPAAAALGAAGGALNRVGKSGANLGSVLGAAGKSGAIGGAGAATLGALGKLGGGAFGDPSAGGVLSGLGGLFGGGGEEGEQGVLRRILGGLGGAAGDALGALGGGNPLLGAGALGLLGAELKGSRDQRKSAEAFEQKRLDMLMEALAGAEEEWESRGELRDASQAAILGAIGQHGQRDLVGQWLDTMQTRQPGEFMTRGGA